MDSNSQTLIVVMPVYNSQETLAMAIESVLSQSYRNIRLIVVDDASTDHSLEIAKLYLKDKRVIILKNTKNMGAYYSRNVGLNFASNFSWGYFTTHDSDDVSFKHRYLKIMRKMKNHSTVGVKDTFRRVNLNTGLEINVTVTSAHAVFKKEIFDAIGYFEHVRFGADWEHWQRAAAFVKNTGHKLDAIHEVVGESFVHKNNLTVQIPQKSKARRSYMVRSRKKIAEMSKNRSWHYGFNVDHSITERVE